MSADLWIEGTNVNLTYNLSPMLREAGLPRWRHFTGAPCSESGGVFARVSRTLKADPERFKAMNPPNGWGDYELAVDAVDQLADLCAQFPAAHIETWL